MTSWIERVRRMVLEAPPPVLLQADSQWGVNRLIAGMRAVEQPLIWLDAASIDCADPGALGDALSEAIRSGLGAPLFGTGTDGEYALSALESYLPALEPVSIVVGSAHDCIELSKRLLRSVRPPNTLVLQVPQDCPSHNALEFPTVIGTEQLAIRLHEALDMYGAEREPDEVSEAIRASGGAISQVEHILGLAAVGAEVGEGVVAVDGVPAASYKAAPGVDVLLLRGNWIEALEQAVAYSPTRVPEVIEEAGHALLDAGQFERLWQTLSLLPGWVLRQEAVMYWQFNAAIAVNRWRPMLPLVDRYLQRREAPRLRALRASVEIGRDSLGEARRAFDADSNAVTASALGFVLSVSGDVQGALQVLKVALERSERDGRARLIVSSAGNIAIAHISGGQYVRAQYWANWALRQFSTFGLREELLRLHLVNLAAYTSLLTGSVSAAERVLSAIHVPDEMVGIPTIEGLLSTLGDYAFVRGDPSSALDFYERTAEKASRADLPTVANDLVRGYLGVGRLAEALKVAREAVETASDVTEVHGRLAELALGTALGQQGNSDAERLLRGAVGFLAEKPFVAYCGQAVIQLGAFYVRQGRAEEARRLLNERSQFIAELGESGWLLLGGRGPEVMQLKRMFRVGEPQIELQLLGKRRLRNQGVEGNLSLRHAELLAMLAANPNGIRGEALGLALYGDRANMSTLKATVSRARKLVPIESQPYRIGEAYRADFMHVMDLLRMGTVQAALELYRGPLLPESDAPGVVELRGHLEESVRQAVLASGDPDAMIDLAGQQGDDLELWEETRRHLTPNDPRRPLASARIRRIRKRWRSEGG